MVLHLLSIVQLPLETNLILRISYMTPRSKQDTRGRSLSAMLFNFWVTFIMARDSLSHKGEAVGFIASQDVKRLKYKNETFFEKTSEVWQSNTKHCRKWQMYWNTSRLETSVALLVHTEQKSKSDSLKALVRFWNFLQREGTTWLSTSTILKRGAQLSRNSKEGVTKILSVVFILYLWENVLHVTFQSERGSHWISSYKSYVWASHRSLKRSFVQVESTNACLQENLLCLSECCIFGRKKKRSILRAWTQCSFNMQKTNWQYWEGECYSPEVMQCT